MTDDESDSDKEVTEVHVSKARKIERKSGRPKAGDFKEADKELVLMAANIYRVLLASQDAFPNASTEMTLVKKAWKQMNVLENSDVGLMNKLRWSLNTIGTRVEQGICYVLDQTDKVSTPTGLSTYTQGKRGYTLWLCYESIPLLVNIRLLIMMQYHAILI